MQRSDRSYVGRARGMSQRCLDLSSPKSGGTALFLVDLRPLPASDCCLSSQSALRTGRTSCLR
eukprot:scaffold178771_cov35-Tisochrysis_lutea.AAC.1